MVYYEKEQFAPTGFALFLCDARFIKNYRAFLHSLLAVLWIRTNNFKNSVPNHRRLIISVQQSGIGLEVEAEELM